LPPAPAMCWRWITRAPCGPGATIPRASWA